MRPAYKAWTGQELLDVLSVKLLSNNEIIAIKTIYGKMTHGYTLIPYTGFLDSKGNPIYVGDVLMLVRKTSPLLIAATLVEINSLRAITNSITAKHYDTLEKLKASDVEFEVMGNKFQNPDLLYLYAEEGDELGRI